MKQLNTSDTDLSANAKVMKKPKFTVTEIWLKRILGVLVVIIIVLSVWLGFSGGFVDLFRKEGDGVEPTAGRMTSTCLSNAMLVMGDGGEMVCGKMGDTTEGNEEGTGDDGGAGEAAQVYMIRMADESVETGKEFYNAVTDNMSRGTVTVVLENSDEMFKYLEIIGEDAYVLRAYYLGKKLQVSGNDLTVMEDTLAKLGAPNRNRADTQMEAITAARNERKNAAALAMAKYYIERYTSYDNELPELGDAISMINDLEYVVPEMIMNIDENSTTGLGRAYSVMVSERSPATDYRGEKLYFAATSVPRPDLMVSGMIPANQILFHYNAKCENGNVIGTEEVGVNGRPLFAMTFPKLDGVSYYCITGNLE